MASTLHMRTTISHGQWPYCGVTRVCFSARIILYKYKISCERSTYPYPKSNIFLPHSYLLSSKRSTYCLQDKLLITKNCICTPHRTYFRPAKEFDRILRSHGTSLFQAPTSLPPFPRSRAHIKNKINNDLQVAHPHSGSSSTWFLVELEFENVGFWGEGKTGVLGEKPLGARERTNNKLNPHMSSTPRFEPGPHWWKASVLTTALPLALIFSRTFHLRVIRTI